jgi:hypothetical protein
MLNIPRFFISPSANTVICELDAHHDIAFACAALLIASLSLIDPALTEQQRPLRVGSGHMVSSLMPLIYGLNIFWRMQTVLKP